MILYAYNKWHRNIIRFYVLTYLLKKFYLHFLLFFLEKYLSDITRQLKLKVNSITMEHFSFIFLQILSLISELHKIEISWLLHTYIGNLFKLEIYTYVADFLLIAFRFELLLINPNWKKYSSLAPKSVKKHGRFRVMFTNRMEEEV